MESLTSGSSFFGVADVSLEVVFFTFGAAFSPVFESLTVMRRRGFKASLGSALAGGNLRWSAEAALLRRGSWIKMSGPGRILVSPASSPCGLGVADLLRSFEPLVLPMDLMRLAAGSPWSWPMDLLWRLTDLCLGPSSGSGAVVGSMESGGGVSVGP